MEDEQGLSREGSAFSTVPPLSVKKPGASCASLESFEKKGVRAPRGQLSGAATLQARRGRQQARAWLQGSTWP